MILAPSCGKILKLVCLLSLLQCSEPSADSLPFAFPGAELKVKFVVSSGLQIWAGFLHTLSSHLPKLGLANWEHPEGAGHRRGGVWVRHRALGVPMGPLGGSARVGFPAAHGWAS